MSRLWTVKAHQLAEAQAVQLVEIARDTDDDTPLRADPRAAAGDEQRLRGIPVVGARGVPGHIPGTRP